LILAADLQRSGQGQDEDLANEDDESNHSVFTSQITVIISCHIPRFLVIPLTILVGKNWLVG
jgi:hypothetical protein